MRTLVVSDLHLGTRSRRDVLRRPVPLDALVQALERVDRLVLLGDIVDLDGRGRRRAMAVAEPVLRAMGRRVGSAGEVVLVPGNHDRALVRPWLRKMGNRLTVDSMVPLDATPELSALTSWLGPADVTVRYPGVWLSDRLWATHGHYLNRHLLPTSSIGITRGLFGRPPHDAAHPIDYERPAGASLASAPRALARSLGAAPRAAGRVLPVPLTGVARSLGRLARAATMPGVASTLLLPELAPLNASLLTAQMTRASLPALVHVVQRLGVDADWVVFGHVHRTGPLPGDDLSLWQGRDAKPRLANAGSWLYEPLLVNRVTPPHPYWPGGAVALDHASDEPRAVGLLNDVPARAMR